MIFATIAPSPGKQFSVTPPEVKKKAGKNGTEEYICPETVTEQMQQRTEMLHSLFQYATEGIIICDHTGTIQLVNPAAEKIFGYKEGELEGERIEVLLPKRYHRKHVGDREDYTQKPEPRSMGHGRDLYGMRKDGTEIMVEVSLSPFNTAEGTFVMSFVVDITERKKNEIELRLAHERLQQTSEALTQLNGELESKVHERTEELADAIHRLAESKRDVMRALEKEKQLNELKSRFVTTASHEFRTPLGTILSSISLIDRYNAAEDAEKIKKHVERVKSSVSNLTEILNDFLSLEKLEEGIIRFNPQEFDLHALIQEICEDLRLAAKKGQKIVTKLDGKKDVCLDRQLLKNALINLVSNAIKYSPEDKEITIHATGEKNRITIDVIDQGIGIPEVDQQNIFERFFRATNSGNVQGTGLGLNIVRKYIDLMEGEVSFTSKPGEGTTFSIRLPQTINN